MRKITTLIIIFSILAGVPVIASTPEPPEDKNQWAFILADSVELYSKANINSQSRTINAPGEWLKVTASDRDRNNDLWFKVRVNNREGWLSQTGIRLKMGGLNKKASGVYKNCSAIRRKVMNGTMKQL